MPRFEPQIREIAQPAATAECFACEVIAEGRGAAWVTARGELDLACVPQFEQALQEALKRALLLIVDVRALTFIDSIGLRAIVDTDQQARESGRRLVVIRGPGQAGRRFDLVGLTERLKIVDVTPGSLR